MKTKNFSHIFWGLGFSILLSSPFIRLGDRHESYLLLASVGYLVLFVWSIYVLLVCRRSKIIIIEGILGFIVGAVMVPALGRTWIYVFGYRSEYDEPWFMDTVYVLYLHVTNLAILICPFLCNWWKKKRINN